MATMQLPILYLNMYIGKLIKFNSTYYINERLMATMQLPISMEGRLEVMRTSRQACRGLPGGVTALPFEWGFLWFERWVCVHRRGPWDLVLIESVSPGIR